MRTRLCWLLFACCSTVFAENDVDDLFLETPKDVVADVDAKVSDDELLKSPLKISGQFSADIGLISNGRIHSGFSSMDTDFIVDSRPSRVFRLYGKTNIGIAGSQVSAPDIDQLFFDYIIADVVIVRGGRQTISWGQGRIFNPGDLVSDSNDGSSFKVFVPVLGQSFTAVVIGSHFAVPEQPSWRELIYASQLSGDWGPVGWGLAGRYRPGLPRTGQPGLPGDELDRAGSAFVKTVVWGVDLFTEGIVKQDGWHGLAGFYWEVGAPVWKIRGETTTGRVGFAVQWKRTDISPLTKWEHSYVDGSGTLVAGVELYPLPLATLDVGVPWTYGKSGTQYVESNVDPFKRRSALGLKLTINTSF